MGLTCSLMAAGVSLLVHKLQALKVDSFLAKHAQLWGFRSPTVICCCCITNRFSTVWECHRQLFLFSNRLHYLILFCKHVQWRYSYIWSVKFFWCAPLVPRAAPCLPRLAYLVNCHNLKCLLPSFENHDSIKLLCFDFCRDWCSLLSSRGLRAGSNHFYRLLWTKTYLPHLRNNILYFSIAFARNMYIVPSKNYHKGIK